MSSLAMRRLPAQILADAISVMHKMERMNVPKSTDFAPSTKLLRKRPVITAPAIPEIAPAATGIKACRSRVPEA